MIIFSPWKASQQPGHLKVLFIQHDRYPTEVIFPGWKLQDNEWFSISRKVFRHLIRVLFFNRWRLPIKVGPCFSVFDIGKLVLARKFEKLSVVPLPRRIYSRTIHISSSLGISFLRQNAIHALTASRRSGRNENISHHNSGDINGGFTLPVIFGRELRAIIVWKTAHEGLKLP